MAINVLVNGLLERDSGKTWFTIALYNALRSRGYKVGIYKPISGHDGWRQFNTILESIKRSLLVGEDVLNYLNYTDLKYNIILINPIDFLLIPSDYKSYKSTSEYITSLEDQYKQTILVRISNYEEGFTNYYRIPENYNRVMYSLRMWIDKLYGIFNPIDIDIRQLFNILSTKYIDKILDRSLEILSDENDYVLIEAFNNISTPYKNILRNIDVILTVTPGYIIKPRFKKAMELLKKDLGRYMTTEYLLAEAGVDRLINVPPSKNITELSNYIKNNWSKYQSLIE